MEHVSYLFGIVAHVAFFRCLYIGDKQTREGLQPECETFWTEYQNLCFNATTL